jgi:hypothetical protein
MGELQRQRSGPSSIWCLKDLYSDRPLVVTNGQVRLREPSLLCTSDHIAEGSSTYAYVRQAPLSPAIT